MSTILACLLGLLSVAVFTDIYYRKVPNVLVLCGLLIALTFHGVALPGRGVLEFPTGSIGMIPAASGIAVAALAMLPLYTLRAMGAGDVKLMMMVGAFLGPLQTFGVAVLTFSAGGILAVVMALWQRSFRQLALNLRFMLTTSAVHAATGQSAKFEPLQQTAGRMPYAVAIAAGTLLQLALVRNGGWALS